jgi:Immunoglobulin domain/Immunoglobulin I-set domain
VRESALFRSFCSRFRERCTARATLFGFILLFAVVATRADCIQWIQRTDVGSPGPRTSPTMAFDSVHGVTVMFGGETTNGSGGRINPTETWEYNGTNWYQVTITGFSPPGRSYQAMAFDSARGVTMLCGGQNVGGVLKDTWFYASHGDGTGTWTQGPDFDPVGRTGLAMAFDNHRNVMVAMGGMSDLNGTADEPYGTLQSTTYEWNGTSWSFGSPFSFKGSGIARQAMCFDSDQNEVILGGGVVAAYSLVPDGGVCAGPFYEIPANYVYGYSDYLGSWNWIPISDNSFTDCGGFSQSAIAYDSRRHQSVLFGGSSLTTAGPGTQEFPVYPPTAPSNDWNPLYLPTQPPLRSRHAMAYDSWRGVTVLFGGENANGSGPMGDTWELVANTPAITVTVPNQQACQGTRVSFAANISGGSGPFLYQWQFNGVNLSNNARISGATNSSLLTIDPVTTNDAGIYTLTTVDTCDNITYGQPATLTINYPPSITSVVPSSLALCPGDSGSLSVFYDSPLPVTYQWAQNGIPISGQTNQQLNFVSATTNQSGLYTVSVSDACGGVGSDSIPVSVGVWVRLQPLPTNNATLCQPRTLSVLARGKGSLTAQWFRNGALIVPDSRIIVSNVLQSTGDTLCTLNFADILYQDDATYTVTITDDCGPVNAGPFAMTVQPNPPWVQIATTGPSPRWDTAMAYDSDRRVSVLFGGQVYNPTGSPVIGDTWEFDGTNWMQRLPSTSPAARSLAQMVYDSHRHRTVLFGGQIFNGSSLVYSPETWEWDGANWQKITTTHVPGFTQTGYRYAACFDSVRNEMLLFGGVTNTGIISQLWSYDGTDWHLKPPSGPAPVYTASLPTMAFDTNRGMAVLVGGGGGTVPNGYGQSVWEWDGAVWHERLQSGQEPTLNSPYNGFAYDTFRQECVLYGAENGLANGQLTSFYYPYPDYLRYVWRWNGRQWAADPPTPTPGVTWHYHHSMVFDSARNALVVFGGQQNNGTANTNYTFEILYQDDPVVLKQPQVQVSLLGQQVQLSVLGAGAPPISYQWRKAAVNVTDGGRISGSTSNTLTINPTISADSGSYMVGLSNLCGMASSLPIQLQIYTSPLSIVVSGTSLQIIWTDPAAELQSAPNPAGPYTTIIGAMSPYVVSPTGPTQFYRLIHL